MYTEKANPFYSRLMANYAISKDKGSAGFSDISAYLFIYIKFCFGKYE